jgi:TRAP-type mannitol/chloroaromatic compound transport system permease small subunit
LERVLRGVDRLNEAIARLVAWFVLVLALTMTYEVAARYVFGRPTMWSYDVSYFLNSAVVMLGAAYTLHRRGHVSVDILYATLPVRARAFLDVALTLALFFPLWALLAWAMVPHVQYSWRSGERALTGTWLPPIYPFKTWVLLGIVLLLLQGVVEFVRAAAVLVGGKREA